jgi:hypothetical protein
MNVWIPLDCSITSFDRSNRLNSVVRRGLVNSAGTCSYVRKGEGGKSCMNSGGVKLLPEHRGDSSRMMWEDAKNRRCEPRNETLFCLRKLSFSFSFNAVGRGRGNRSLRSRAY